MFGDNKNITLSPCGAVSLRLSPAVLALGGSVAGAVADNAGAGGEKFFYFLYLHKIYIHSSICIFLKKINPYMADVELQGSFLKVITLKREKTT